MNDVDGNPVFPRNGLVPQYRTGIVCMRMIKKPRPIGVYDRRSTGQPPCMIITHELCRGEIVGPTGLEHCAYCGAVPSWA